MALESLGDAWVDVHARVDKNFDEDIVSGVKKELKDADSDIEKVGQDFGKTLSKGMEKEIGTHGPDLGRSVEKAIEKEVVEVAPNWHYNVRGKDGRFIRRMVTDIEDEVGRAFASTSASFFGKISQGISDAVGAGFNIPGGSPLISILIPAVGALIGLVVGAVQAVNSLIAVLSTAPALVAAIALQVGVLYAAFKGVGTAIQGAFAATNAKELNEAIKGLTPAAQTFVRQLLPLKGLFESLSKIAQQNFFKALGDVVPRITKVLGPLLSGGFGPLATALGGLFRQIGLFFASPTFREFVSKIIPATVDFLNSFGPDFAQFLKGFVEFATATIPFLTSLGHLLGDVLAQVGTFFMQAARDPATKKWFDDMFNTFVSLVSLVYALTGFVTTLLSALNEAGGQEVLDEIVTDIQLLTGFLASDTGQKALEGLIHVVIFALQVTTGLIVAFLFIFAELERFFEWLTNTALPAIGSFFAGLGMGIWHGLDVAGQAIRDFVFAAGNWFAELGLSIWHGLDIAGQAIRDFVLGLGRGIAEGFRIVVDFFVGLWRSINDGNGRLLFAVAQLPNQIMAALGNLGNLLWNAGASLVQGLVNGIASRVPHLRDWMRYLANIIAAFLPGSPAKEGPLSGQGYTKIRGEHLVQDLVTGMQNEAPALRAASFNTAQIAAGVTNINFNGPVTEEAGRLAGNAASAQILGMLNANASRLAVRMA